MKELDPFGQGATILDSWASWRIREWIESPDAPLPAGVFVTLLTSGSVHINEESFWPTMVPDNARWRGEFDLLSQKRKFVFFQSPGLQPYLGGQSPSTYAYDAGLGSGPELDDFMSLLYAEDHPIPLSVTPASPSRIETVIEKLDDFRSKAEQRTITFGADVDNSVGPRGGAISLVMQAEAPDIHLRGLQRFNGYNEAYYGPSSEYGAVRKLGPDGMSALFPKTFRVTCDYPVFVTPEELIGALKDEEACLSLRVCLHEIINRGITAPDEMKGYAAEVWDRHIKRMKIAEWVFDGLAVSFLYLGMIKSAAEVGGLIGAGVEVAGRVIKRKIGYEAKWIVAFRELNHEIRKSDSKARKGGT